MCILDLTICLFYPLTTCASCSIFPKCNEIITRMDVSPQNGDDKIRSAEEDDDSNGKKESDSLLNTENGDSMKSWPDEEKVGLQDILTLTFCLSAYAVNKFVAEVLYVYHPPYSVLF